MAAASSGGGVSDAITSPLNVVPEVLTITTDAAAAGWGFWTRGAGQPLAGGDVWRPDQAVCSSNWRECECVRLSPQRRAATGLLGPATSGRVVVVRSDNICAVAMVTKLWSGAAATAVMWCGDGGAMGRRTEGRQHRTKGWRCEAAVLERLRVQHSAQALAALPHDSEQQQQRGFPPRPPVAGPRGAGRHCVD